MNIQNSLRKLFYEPGREQAHISRETDEINFVLLQRGDHFAIVSFAFFALGRNDERFQATPFGSFYGSGIGAV